MKLKMTKGFKNKVKEILRITTITTATTATTITTTATTTRFAKSITDAWDINWCYDVNLMQKTGLRALINTLAMPLVTCSFNVIDWMISLQFIVYTTQP